MTDDALPILKGEASINLRRDTIRKASKGPRVKALVSEEDAPLLSALKAKRRALAEAAKVPAYVIFNDRTLIEMAESRPATLAEKKLNGIIFFIDPMTAHPHDVDVKALIRLAIVHQIPMALNQATADAVIRHLDPNVQ